MKQVTWIEVRDGPQVHFKDCATLDEAEKAYDSAVPPRRLTYAVDSSHSYLQGLLGRFLEIISMPVTRISTFCSICCIIPPLS